MQSCPLHPAPLDTCRKSLLTPVSQREGFVLVGQMPALPKEAQRQGEFFSRERSTSATRRFIVAALPFLGLLLSANIGNAHPLGNFSISQYSALRVAADSVAIRYIIDMAEIPTFQEIQDAGIVPNGDDPNTRAYLAKKIVTLRDGLSLEIGGRRLPLHADSTEIIFPPGAGGLPTLKIGVSFQAKLPASVDATSYYLNYRDGNFAGRAGWKEIVALSGSGAVISNSSVPESDRSAQLSNYPTDLLNSPPQDLEARVSFQFRLPRHPREARKSHRPWPPRSLRRFRLSRPAHEVRTTIRRWTSAGMSRMQGTVATVPCQKSRRQLKDHARQVLIHL